MKQILLTVLSCFLLTGLINAQEEASSFTGENSRQRERDPKSDQFNYVPNEIIVKFKDEVNLSGELQLKSTGLNGIDAVLKSAGMEKMEKLFPNAEKLKSAKVVKSPLGQDMVIPSLHNIYKIALPELKSGQSNPVNIHQYIEELQQQPEVEYAEPNYIYSIDDLKPAGPELTASDLERRQSGNRLKNATAAVEPEDPLYSEQWYIPAIKADLVWEQTTGDSSQVIAILDTGVDTEHPDLKNKIWRNPDEIPGNGMDDDGNGLVDDVMGWDYINNDNNPMDDNSHGTHVAGIAAAESNNGIGIAGVNWHAKIMPVKVFQSSGRGDAANISQGIIYATQKGATAINMSFGSYARSMTMENALANAYATSLLVAAAGNDGIYVETCIPSGPFFPAALSYVLGVQSPDGSFSNLDCNGPTFSNTSELFNYEMKAPGTNIISAIPGGNYRTYQGTSMATPAVAAAVSLYRKLIPSEEETNEFMWVKLIQATSTYLDISKALTIEPVPEVWFLNKVMVDDCPTCDNDGRVDSGETIKLWFNARNTGGQVDSVYWKIQLAEFEDPATCSITKATTYIGSISPYATRTSEDDPMVIEISPDVVHDRDITFDLLSWYKGAQDTLIQKFVLTAENGEELKDILTDVKTLSPNRLYLVNQSFMVGATGTLIIKPGTKMLFYPGKTIPVSGNLIAEGTPDSLIYFIGYIPPGSDETVGPVFSFRNENNPNHTKFSYCHFENLSTALHAEFSATYYPFLRQPSVYNSTFTEVQSIGIADTLINNQFISPFVGLNYSGVKESFYHTGYLERNNFIGPPTSTKYRYDYPLTNLFQYFNDRVRELKYNNFINYRNAPENGENAGSITEPEHQNNWISEYSKEGIIYTKVKTHSWEANEFHSFKSQYWGTSDSAKIENMFYDFMENPMLPRAQFSPYLTAPVDSAHAVVWKVLINGKDGQDETVEPVGVGKQRFDVYFNRPMDKTITPNVSFGVRYPFSSNAVNEDGSWSEDGRIFTTYKTIKLTTGDGINRIRVSGAKDLEGWEIPLEDMRFEFLINAAGSASANFMATPGLGMVSLEWNDNDLEDGLGYNMYRMEQINDSTLSEPEMVNATLITDTLYTDFAVTPNKKYFYYYKILRTNLEETDSSKVVAAIPFTADLGDANGDLAVNVSDVVTTVSYILENNPQPFIFEAADINGDGVINVLDIVGVVNLILSPEQQTLKGLFADNAEISIEDGIVYVNSPLELGGIQFTLADVTAEQEVEVLEALDGFEVVRTMKEDKLVVLAYSLSGKTIAEGKTALLKLNSSKSWIFDVVLSNPSGSSINWEFTGEATGTDQLKLNAGFELGQNYPNPFTGNTTIPFELEMEVDEVQISVFDIMGRKVKTWQLDNLNRGEHKLEYTGEGHTGVYLYKMYVKQNGQRSYTKTKRMIVQ